MNRFFFAISGVVFAILLSGRIALKLGWIITLPSFFYETTLLVVFTTGVIFIYLFKSNNPTFFVQLYLLSMSVKLLAYLGYNLFMLIEDKPGGVVNVLYFLFNYFVFTFVEIVFLYRKISDKPRS